MLSYYQTLKQKRKSSILDSELVFGGKQVLLYANQKCSKNAQWQGCSVITDH